MLVSVIFILCIVVAGCGNNPAADSHARYGRLMYEDSDSLLQVVTAEDTAQMSEDERMLHRLMYSAAMSATGQCSTDTAVMEECERYYNDRGCDKMEATAMMLHAEMAFNSFDHKKALVKLLEAEKIARCTDDNALMYKICSLLYRVNNETGCTTQSMKYCRRAMEHAHKSGYADLMIHAANDMASVLMAGRDYKGARRYLDGNVSLLDDADRRSRSEYYRVMGEYYLCTDSMECARRMLGIADSITPTAETFYDIAITYEKLGDKEQLKSYCYSAITADQRGDVSIRAYNKIIENLENNIGYNSVLNICKNLNKLYLAKAELADAIEMERIQTEYIEEDESDIYLYVAATAVILLLTATFLFMRRHNKKSGSDDGSIMLMNENIVYELHKNCNLGKPATQEQWIALRQAVNRHIPFFLARLHKINDLSARDVNICILTRLHFSPSEIGILTEISPQNVTNSRARLLGKIFGVKGGATEFDRRINAMHD